MKNIFTSLTVALLSFSSFIFSQNKIEKIDGGFSIKMIFEEPDYKDVKNNFLTIRDYHEFTDISRTGEFKLPSQTFLIAIPAFSKPEIAISNTNVKIIKNIIPKIQPKAIRLNDSTIINEDVEYSNAKISGEIKKDMEVLGYTWYHQNYCAVVKINTHKFDLTSNQIERISVANINVEIGNDYNLLLDLINENNNTQSEKTDNSIIVNNQIADQFAAQQPLLLQDTTGNWINYGSEYLKIGTAKDALFRITKTDLEAKGINVTSVNPKTFRLIESGVEIPITVFGQEDNSFDANDYIQFYGTLNYPKISHRVINAPNEPYNEYLNRYSDTTFYFLAWGLQDGKRIQSQNVFNSGLTDSLTYYNYVEHKESNKLFQNFYTDEVDNQTPGWLRNKTWYNLQTLWLYSNTTRNYNFTIADAVPNKIAKFFYKAVSGGSNITSNAHQVIIKVNSVLLDSQSIDRNEQLLLTGTLNTNQFITNPNIISVKNYSNGTNPNYLGDDWYDVEYPRYLKLNNNFLLFNVSNDINNGLKVIKIQNATAANYEVYKVKPYFKKIDNVQIISNQILFTDTVRVGDQYIVETSALIEKPVFYYKKQFINLRSVTSQADYLAITHPKFLQSAGNYINTVTSLYGATKGLVSIEDIFDEFSFGYPQPEAIRLFAAVTYQKRQNPKPQYLTLIGDADYDYKLYRFKADGVRGGGNYVPSFGNPVSDNWFAVWNDSLPPLPQLKVGRIPVNTNEELDYYLSKVQNNFNDKFDEWNKRFILFSGGRADYPDELAQLKSVNDQIIFNHIKPAPLSGSATHFYKTTNPLSDFGPYTPEFISKTIDEGGVFISYLGHSGTATWDNSISETIQLKNNFNKNPLITDFGCSTNKFAEPDIISFGERFLLNSNGQALGYIGNSSLGFTTTSLTIPIYFYELILKSPTKEIGEAHLSAKDSMFSKIGTSGVFRLFALTNTLIGDPLIRIKVPSQPNLKINSADLLFENEIINDTEDSLILKIVINNFGTSDTLSFNYSVQQSFNGNVVKNFVGRKSLPGFKDTVSVWLKIKNLSGEHSLNISLDTNLEINEIYEDDNILNSTFYVYSTALRDLVKQRIENPALNKLRILNPSVMDDKNFSIKLQISETEDFHNFQEYTILSDSFNTDYNFTQLTANTRFWYRFSIDEIGSSLSGIKSFYNNQGTDFFLIDSTSFNEQFNVGLYFRDNKILLGPEVEEISVTSAGYNIGRFCIISKNGINLLANTFFAGMGIVVFNEYTMEVDTSAYFNLFNNPTNMTALVNLISSIPDGKIVAMGVATDAANNITLALKNAIKTLGSTKIDTLAFGESWALIGKKGATSGNILEEIKVSNELVYIDTLFIIPSLNGKIETIEIGPSTDWQDYKVIQNIPSGSSINHYVYGIKNDLNVDSLGLLTLTNSTSDLSFINPQIYPKIKIKSVFNASPEGISPELSSLGVDYVGLPELGLNYQVVSLDKDTLVLGDDLNIKFWLYNVGESSADTVKVTVNVIAPLNTFVNLLDTIVYDVAANSKVLFDLTYQNVEVNNPASVVINIDPENIIDEYFEDNNFFTKSFYVQSDIIPPTLKITFDEAEVVNGDFVSNHPNIKISVSDNSAFPITDPNQVKVFLNVSEVERQELNDSLFSQDQTITYNPTLEDGDYLLTVIADDNSGNTDSSDIYFVVSSETKLHQVYNYPNPFASETYFTFRLSQIPDEVKIRVYTIAGRLIKEISKKSSELNYDLNRILWDGKDEDGDVIANGTYLYKVIMKDVDKVESVTQKLVILK